MLAAEDRRRRPPTRPTCTACSTTSSQLVLVFPEGRKGTEKLYKDRYRLRRFGRGGFVEAAMRARAPIVPIAVVGAEEAAPIFAHVPLLQRLTGPHLLPDHADVPAPRPARHGSATCRRSSRSASCRRCAPTTWATSRGRTRRLVQTVAHDIRATIQEELLDMVGKRRQRLVRMTLATRILITGPVDLLGRPAGPGAGAATRRSRRSSASTAARRRSSSSAPSSSRSPTRTR